MSDEDHDFNAYKKPMKRYLPLRIYEGFVAYGNLELDLSQSPKFNTRSKSEDIVFLPGALVIRGNFFIEATKVNIDAQQQLINPKHDVLLPVGLEVHGHAFLKYGTLQGNTHIHGDLDLTGNYNTAYLPEDLRVDGYIDVTNSAVTHIPWQVAEHAKGIIGIDKCYIEQKPEHATETTQTPSMGSQPDPNQMNFGWTDPET